MKSERKVALVTGGSRRIGAAIVRRLHSRGMDIAIHYHRSGSQADQLCDELNGQRPDSACTFRADLSDLGAIQGFANRVIQQFGRLDVLVNNASVIDCESNAALSTNQYRALLDIHVGAPYYLTSAVAPALKESTGCIVNITDIYAQRPKTSMALYSASKAGLESLTKSFALELAPDVRVNAIAPGAILWLKNAAPEESILDNTPLGRLGTVDEIADAVSYLVFEATFTTGQVVTVDGGRLVASP
ncbi:MAG: pteridine reductase [Acidiferrobacterales bacterium]|nr:pteridine reductase [Acidiferrobacterales bacterium]